MCGRRRPSRRLGVGQLEPLLLLRLRERPLAATDHHREHHRAQRVDEVVLDQRVHERGAASHQDRPAVLLLQLSDLLGDVAPDQGRVVPLERVLKRRGDDVRKSVTAVTQPSAANAQGRDRALSATTARWRRRRRYLSPRRLPLTPRPMRPPHCPVDVRAPMEGGRRARESRICRENTSRRERPEGLDSTTDGSQIGARPNRRGRLVDADYTTRDARLTERSLFAGKKHGEGQNRTGDTTIFSRVLYQLSYLAVLAARRW
jgi:hypothetical protein